MLRSPGVSLRTPAAPTLELFRQVESGREEGEAELTHLHLGAVGETKLSVDPGTIAERSVQGAQVSDRKIGAAASKLSVATRHGHVIKKDIDGGVTAGHSDVLIKQEARTEIRATPDDEQGRTRRQRLDRLALVDRQISGTCSDHGAQVIAELLSSPYLSVVCATCLVFGVHVFTQFLLLNRTFGPPGPVPLRYRRGG